MTLIPKRPEIPTVSLKDPVAAVGIVFDRFREQREYEHAVAVRAVEALMVFADGSRDAADIACSVALDEIKASGWTP